MLDELPPLAHVDAETVDEAVYWLGRYGPRAKLLAGGTDLLGLMKDRISGPRMPLPDVLVSIKRIPELGRIVERPDGALRIGATVTLTDLERDPIAAVRYPALAQAARAVATGQIRAVGTVGGNLMQRPWCWYFRHPQFECFKRGGRQCFAIPGSNRTYFSVLNLGICVMSHPSDLAPALLALDARVGAAGPAGAREIPIERFFKGPRSVSETALAPDEVLTWVEVPPPAPGARSAFLKHRIRDTWDFALAEVAVARSAHDGDVRVALGGIAPFPFRAMEAEAVLRGRRLDEQAVGAAAAAVVAKARPLAMNGYKVDVTRALVRRALAAVAD
jgi:xanthine dehydrogenase YagS FAD-binding subunit